MRNESGREEEKSPNMKHCFLSGRARAGINCQWSHFRAMSVYLYWLWTDHLAGASCSEAWWASQLWLTREETVMTQVLCTVQRSAGIWFGEVQSEPRAGQVKDTSFSLLALCLSNLDFKVVLVHRWAQHTLLWLTGEKWGRSEPNEIKIINWNLTTLQSEFLAC